MLRWTDNAYNESGFEIQRLVASDTWDTAGTVAADAASATISGLSGWSHAFRVRATGAGENSGWSNEAAVMVMLVHEITVTSITEGDVWALGQTVNITWTGLNVSGVVLEVSRDGGDNWVRITEGAMIQPTDPDWGNFAWVVQGIESDNVVVRITDYQDHGIFVLSPVISIGPTGAAPHMHRVSSLCTGLHGAGLFSAVDGHSFTYSLKDAARALLNIYRLNGELVTRLSLSGVPGIHRVHRDGTSASGQAAGRGTFAARLVVK